MDPIEQQIEIAKACGWREAFPTSGSAHHGTRKGGIMLPYTWINEADGRRVQDLPNYLRDLNAMHEAEKVLTELQTCQYVDALCKVVSSGYGDFSYGEFWNLIHAAPKQKAEAFLRTIGKWKE